MTKKKILILIALGVLIILAFFLIPLLFKPQGPLGIKLQITSVSPQPDEQEASLLPEISIFFNQQIAADQVTFSADPSFPYHQITEDTPPNALRYLPDKLLEKKTKYQITLLFKFGGGYTWSFTTSETEVGSVPGWAENFRKSEEEYLKNHPPEEVGIINALIEKMPYYTGAFWIEYFTRSDTFAVHLCQEPFEKTKGEAEDWFGQQRTNKLAVLKLKIDWLYGCKPPLVIPGKITP